MGLLVQVLTSLILFGLLYQVTSLITKGILVQVVTGLVSVSFRSSSD